MALKGCNTDDLLLESSFRVVLPQSDLIVFRTSQEHIFLFASVEAKNDVRVAHIQLCLPFVQIKELERFAVRTQKCFARILLQEFEVDYLVKIQTLRRYLFKAQLSLGQTYVINEHVLV